MPTKKEIFLFFNTLSSVVKGLEGQYTTIDLRDEACVTGKIINVDACMNVELEDVILYDRRGIEHSFENFFVNSRLIRYVHIPKDLPAMSVVERQLQDLTIVRPKSSHNFNTLRAKRYHQETVQSLQKNSKEVEIKSEPLE